MPASLLMTKSDDKAQTVVTINGSGIYYQELRLGDRPMSGRVRIGKLVLIDGEVMAEYDELTIYDALLSNRVDIEKKLAAVNALLKENATDERRLVADNLAIALDKITEVINENPTHRLQSLNAKVFQSVDRLLDKVRYRHKHVKGEKISFTHYPTRAYFLQKQAEDLLKRRNEALEASGREDGYLDFDGAMLIIERRYAENTAAKTKKKAKAAVAE
jgi:hypothetical protein